MKIGLSTYAYFWRLSEKSPKPMSLFDALDDCSRLGANVFQICDYPQIMDWSPSELSRLALHASQNNITLELGTKGIQTEHLQRYLAIAEKLDCVLLRSMINTPTHKPTLHEAQKNIEEVLPLFEKAGVSLCLETYEQVPTDTNLALVKTINSPLFGICLDPANCVASLENPMELVTKVAPYVLNWHVKDFVFSRSEGWVGFQLIGCPLGEGLLPYDEIYQKIQPKKNTINQIIEHWLPWQGDAEKTCCIESEWTEKSLRYLIDKN